MDANDNTLLLLLLHSHATSAVINGSTRSVISAQGVHVKSSLGVISQDRTIDDDIGALCGSPHLLEICAVDLYRFVGAVYFPDVGNSQFVVWFQGRHHRLTAELSLDSMPRQSHCHSDSPSSI